MEETKAPSKVQRSNAAAQDVPQPVKQKLKMRGSLTLVHHLFRAQLADFLKNKSWKKDQPDITKVPHVHFFHTITSNGKVQHFTTAVGGHFHEVSWEIDAKTGEPIAKCGPPLKKVAVPGIDGITVYENREIEFFDKVGSMGKRNTLIKDNHVHTMTYEGSDEFTTEQIRSTQAANRAGIQDGLNAARATLNAEGVGITE